MKATPQPFRFLDLPTELRLKVYRNALREDSSIMISGEDTSQDFENLALATNTQIREEATPIYYGSNKFIFNNLSEWSDASYQDFNMYLFRIDTFNARLIIFIAINVPFIMEKNPSGWSCDDHVENVTGVLKAIFGETSVKELEFISPPGSSHYSGFSLQGAKELIVEGQEPHKIKAANEVVWILLKECMCMYPRTHVILTVLCKQNPLPWSERDCMVEHNRYRYMRRLQDRLGINDIRHRWAEQSVHDWFKNKDNKLWINYTLRGETDVEDSDEYLGYLRYLFEDRNWCEVEQGRILSHAHAKWKELQRLLC